MVSCVHATCTPKGKLFSVVLFCFKFWLVYWLSGWVGYNGWLAIQCRSELFCFFFFQGKKLSSWWQRILIPFLSSLATLRSLVKVCSFFFKLCLPNFVFLVNHVLKSIRFKKSLDYHEYMYLQIVSNWASDNGRLKLTHVQTLCNVFFIIHTYSHLFNWPYLYSWFWNKPNLQLRLMWVYLPSVMPKVWLSCLPIKNFDVTPTHTCVPISHAW